jgi:hypothetical protein
VEESVKLRFYLTFVIGILSLSAVGLNAQALDSFVGQITNSAFESFAGSASGNGRFVVFESKGDLATENPRNADGNLEIFLWDAAQRRIFQITDTKSLLTDTTLPSTFDNVRVEILNTRPVISNDGKWIAFSSNATIAFPGDGTNPPIVSSTNPGSFDANAFTAPTPTPSPSPAATPTPGANNLTNDGNLEMWIYQIPAYTDVPDLANGDELPVTNLAPFNADGSPTGGTFIRVTNTAPSQLPVPGSPTTNPGVAADNHDASISDDGHALAFVSTRDLVPSIGNPGPTTGDPDGQDNDEIFTAIRVGQSVTLNQVTKTPRGSIGDPIYNKNPTISGNGSRVAFASTGDNPIVGMTGGNNPSTSRNEEIFFSDLDATGGATGIKRQVTTTTPTTAGSPVNILDHGARMSRDGRYIAFDSFADLADESNHNNFTSFALYLYDTTLSGDAAFKRIGPRSDADSAATGGDVGHFPGFTDNSATGVPTTLLLETRENIKPDGTIPATATDGMNSDATRPAQIYSFPLSGASPTFKRLTIFPAATSFLSSTQPLPTNSHNRMAFNLSLSELGTGNSDLQSEAYYLLQPDSNQEQNAAFSFATGASRLAINPSPTPTPSPTATPTPTPTPTGSPTPTPVTPSAVLGLSPGLLAVVQIAPPSGGTVVARSAVGSLMRSFTLPIEMSHISISINGAACGLKSISQVANNRFEVVFVVPPALTADPAGTSYPMVVNNNGSIYRTSVTLVPAQPDIFTTTGSGPGGRAKIFNVTNRVATTEPFTVFTVQIRGGLRVPSNMRLYMTGVQGMTAGTISIRIEGSTTTATGDATLVEPGVYTVDFAMPTDLVGAGDQPIVVTVSPGGVAFSSRLDDTAPRLSIL